jgi:hypothetical protein
MTQSLPESPIDGLIVRSVDGTGRTHYEPIFCKVLAASQYNPNQFSLAGLIGYWELDDRIMRTLTGQTLTLGTWYKFALTTKLKPESPRTNAGSMYQDIRQVRLATDDEIPEQEPTATRNPQQSGLQAHDDRFRTKKELRWTESFHMATRVQAGLGMSEGMSEGEMEALLVSWAGWFYNELVSVNEPTPIEREELEPSEPEMPPAADEEPPASDPF